VSERQVWFISCEVTCRVPLVFIGRRVPNVRCVVLPVGCVVSIVPLRFALISVCCRVSVVKNARTAVSLLLTSWRLPCQSWVPWVTSSATSEIVGGQEVKDSMWFGEDDMILTGRLRGSSSIVMECSVLASDQGNVTLEELRRISCSLPALVTDMRSNTIDVLRPLILREVHSNLLMKFFIRSLVGRPVMR